MKDSRVSVLRQESPTVFVVSPLTQTVWMVCSAGSPSTSSFSLLACCSLVISFFRNCYCFVVCEPPEAERVRLFPVFCHRFETRAVTVIKMKQRIEEKLKKIKAPTGVENGEKISLMEGERTENSLVQRVNDRLDLSNLRRSLLRTCYCVQQSNTGPSISMGRFSLLHCCCCCILILLSFVDRF